MSEINSMMDRPGGPPGAAQPASPGTMQRTRGFSLPQRTALLLSVLLVGLLMGEGLAHQGRLVSLSWVFSPVPLDNALPRPTAEPTLPPGLNTTTIQHYISKYGFDPPEPPHPLAREEFQRLKQMLPFALAATARYDARHQAQVEPELLLWWTHAEGIGARINYSNCANERPPSGSYFVSISNCDRPDFWQLGYGNQFANIWILKEAFAAMHGDPNDAKLVQQVGQAVLDYDKSQGTIPTCGGFSCTFPALTIDQIMADVHWHASDHKETTSNWWASVLSRDPDINAYMLALALTHFSHEQTRTWVGCYYAEPCWQRLSDALGQILNAWKALGGDEAGSHS